MAATVYGNFLKHALKGDIDTDTDTFKAMVCGSGYTPNKDTHEFRSSVTSEVSGTGYTAGGITLSGITVTVDTTNHRVVLDFSDANFGTVTFSAGTQLIVYKSTGSSATDILVSFHTFSAASPSSANFTYQFSADGLLYISF